MQPLSNVSIKYPAVGRCIYCGDEGSKLSTEHIVPFALEGRLELPEASCGKCALETGRIEQFLARDIAKPFRAKHKFRTRRKSQMPESFSLFVKRGDETIGATVPIEKHPGTLLLPIFSSPRLLLGEERHPDPLWTIGVWHYPDIKDVETAYRSVGSTSTDKVFVGPLRIDVTVRSIAKIAHAACAATRSLDGYQPLLTEIILGTDRVFGHWIGGAESRPAGVKLHEINIQHAVYREREYLMCDVRLFSNLGAPTYRAFVGRRPPPV